MPERQTLHRTSRFAATREWHDPDTLQAEAERLLTETRAIVDAAEAEGRDLSALEQRQVDEQTAEVRTLTSRIAGLRRDAAFDDAFARLGETNADRHARRQGQAAGAAPEQRSATRRTRPDGQDPDALERRLWLPSTGEYREAQATSPGPDGGYLVPVQYLGRFFDRLRARNVFLQALPAGNLIPMTSSETHAPMIGTSAEADVVAENAEIPSSKIGFDQAQLRARKVAGLLRASNEVLSDSSPVELRQIAQYDFEKVLANRLDRQFLEGDPDENPLHMRGLRHFDDAHVTELGDGDGAAPTLDDVQQAIGRLEARDATATAIFMHPTVWTALTGEKDEGGRYQLQPDPAVAAPKSLFGVPVYRSTQIDTDEVVGESDDCTWFAVVDMAQVIVGRRQDVRIVFDTSRYFEFDQTAVRATSRWDLACLNPDAVEIVTGVRPVVVEEEEGGGD